MPRHNDNRAIQVGPVANLPLEFLPGQDFGPDPGAAMKMQQMAAEGAERFRQGAAAAKREGTFSSEAMLRLDAEREKGRRLDTRIAAQQSENEYLEDALAGRTSERDKPAPGTRFTPRYWYGDDTVAKAEREAGGRSTIRKIKEAEEAEKAGREERYEKGITTGLKGTEGEYERKIEIYSQMSNEEMDINFGGPRALTKPLYWENPKTGKKEITEAHKDYDPRKLKPVYYTDKQGRPRVKLKKVGREKPVSLSQPRRKPVVIDPGTEQWLTPDTFYGGRGSGTPTKPLDELPSMRASRKGKPVVVDPGPPPGDIAPGDIAGYFSDVSDLVKSSIGDYVGSLGTAISGIPGTSLGSALGDALKSGLGSGTPPPLGTGRRYSDEIIRNFLGDKSIGEEAAAGDTPSARALQPTDSEELIRMAGQPEVFGGSPIMARQVPEITEEGMEIDEGVVAGGMSKEEAFAGLTDELLRDDESPLLPSGLVSRKAKFHRELSAAMPEILGEEPEEELEEQSIQDALEAQGREALASQVREGAGSTWRPQPPYGTTIGKELPGVFDEAVDIGGSGEPALPDPGTGSINVRPGVASLDPELIQQQIAEEEAALAGAGGVAGGDAGGGAGGAPVSTTSTTMSTGPPAPPVMFGDPSSTFARPGPTEDQLALRAAEKQRLKGRGAYAEGIRHRRRMANENLRNAPRFWYNLTGDAKADAAMGVAMAQQFGNVLGEQVKGRTAREQLLVQQVQFDKALELKSNEELLKMLNMPNLPHAMRMAIMNKLATNKQLPGAVGGGAPGAAPGGGFGGSGYNAGQAAIELERDNPGMMGQLEGAISEYNQDIGGAGSIGDLMEGVSGWFKGDVRKTNSDQLSYMAQKLAGLIEAGQITGDNIALVGPIIGAKLHAELRTELGRPTDRLSRGGVAWSDIQQFMNDIMAGRMPTNHEGLVSPTRTGGLFGMAGR